MARVAISPVLSQRSSPGPGDTGAAADHVARGVGHEVRPAGADSTVDRDAVVEGEAVAAQHTDGTGSDAVRITLIVTPADAEAEVLRIVQRRGHRRHRDGDTSLQARDSL